MFNKFAIMAAGLLIVVVSVPAVVFAQEDETDSSVETSNEQLDQVSEDITAEKRAEQRLERVEAAKEKQNERLSAAEERTIQSKCKVAQVKIDTLQSRLNTVSENRQQTFTRFTDKTSELVQKLEAADVDTTELESAISSMDSLFLSNNDSIASYSTLLSDLAGMDCESDPQGFSALLSEVRTLRTDVIDLQNSAKTQINETLKPVLESIKASLTGSNSNAEVEGGQ